MTPEEIEAARLAEESIIKSEIENDALSKAQEEIARLSEERDNYKAVALKRLGKLPGDAEFLDKDGDGELSVAEQVRIQLLDREIEKTKAAEKLEIERIRKENAELRLAIKNKPGSSIGGDRGASSEVKDGVLTEQMYAFAREKAAKLRVDPDKFIERLKKNLQQK